KVIYQQRNELLEAEQDISETINAIRESVTDELISLYMPPQSIEEQWDILGLEKALSSELHLQLPIREWLEKDPELHEENLRERIVESVKAYYLNKVEQV